MPTAKSARSLTTEDTLVTAASRIPGVVTGVACAGTALESRTFTIARKAFLFVGVKEARLKLLASLGEARKLAEQFPEAVRVGGVGWVTIALHATAGLPSPVLARWVVESHELFAGTGCVSGVGKVKRPR